LLKSILDRKKKNEHFEIDRIASVVNVVSKIEVHRQNIIPQSYTNIRTQSERLFNGVNMALKIRFTEFNFL